MALDDEEQRVVKQNAGCVAHGGGRSRCSKGHDIATVLVLNIYAPEWLDAASTDVSRRERAAP